MLPAGENHEKTTCEVTTCEVVARELTHLFWGYKLSRAEELLKITVVCMTVCNLAFEREDVTLDPKKVTARHAGNARREAASESGLRARATPSEIEAGPRAATKSFHDLVRPHERAQSSRCTSEDIPRTSRGPHLRQLQRRRRKSPERPRGSLARFSLVLSTRVHQ